MKIIIDSRMRKIEKEYLSQYGELIEIPHQTSVYEEISSHPDIFFCKINNKIFKAPNLEMKTDITYEEGKEAVNSFYPEDIKYNICQIGNNVLHNFKYTDTKILEYIKSEKLKQIQIEQGYSKCSICPTSNSSCITSDIGIYKKLKQEDIDVLLIENCKITLLNKKNMKSAMNGFIGGATAIIENKFILFGDSKNILNKTNFLQHLKKYKLQLVEFKNLEIIDYGGIIVQ